MAHTQNSGWHARMTQNLLGSLFWYTRQAPCVHVGIAEVVMEAVPDCVPDVVVVIVAG